ncbi:MarR family winged helix-turn-helix transcriptional regulator [Mycolicibacterium palauense]|uniref:MarR family winged helix-turn-helix transcriptional regulator n=1 Tax=Mycolicibacterium palauense TaxID=2034511 RepID=UPI000BFF1603|nr:MarR family transcriptional regulator [Mycolicibacterium palauense]
MYSVWLSEPQQRLWRDYLEVTTRLNAAMNRQLQQACGLTLPDYDVLVALSEHGRMRVKDLGETLGWEQSRLSHQLRRMRERGLVARFDSTADGRGAEIAVTGEGRAQLRAAAPGHAELVRATVFEGMSDPQARAVGAWLNRVRARLG